MGAGTINVAISQINLSNLYRAQGKCMEADLLYKKAEKILEKIHDKNISLAAKTPIGSGVCIKSMTKLDGIDNLDMQT